jgi:hypothetical protein
MNRQEASLFFRPRVVSCSPVPPNKAMQTGGRLAAAADRQGVIPRCRRTADDFLVFRMRIPRTTTPVPLDASVTDRDADVPGEDG